VSLVSLLTPDSEAELLTIVTMLEARGIPFFVHGSGFGSLFPGAMQVESVNARAIMVPEERVDEALALISDFRSSKP